MPEQCAVLGSVPLVIIPGLEILEVLQNITPEGLQHLFLHILCWKEGQHLDGHVHSWPMHVQRELGCGVSAIAGQHNLGVPP